MLSFFFFFFFLSLFDCGVGQTLRTPAYTIVPLTSGCYIAKFLNVKQAQCPLPNSILLNGGAECSGRQLLRSSFPFLSTGSNTTFNWYSDCGDGGSFNSGVPGSTPSQLSIVCCQLHPSRLVRYSNANPQCRLATSNESFVSCPAKTQLVSGGGSCTRKAINRVYYRDARYEGAFFLIEPTMIITTVTPDSFIQWIESTVEFNTLKFQCGNQEHHSAIFQGQRTGRVFANPTAMHQMQLPPENGVIALCCDSELFGILNTLPAVPSFDPFVGPDNAAATNRSLTVAGMIPLAPTSE
jgi:hypothetical protein